MQIRYYWTTVFLFSVTFSAIAQENWKKVKDEDGIKVYTQTESGSKYKSFKAEMQVICKIDDILFVLKHSDSLNRWVVNCKVVKLLKTEGQDQYFYIETSLPMPFQNRDMVYHFQYKEISSAQLRVSVTGIPDYIGPLKGIARMEKADGFWLLTSIDSGTVNVTYQMHVEPGGIIPAWLVNPFIKNVPFSTFRELRKIVQDSKLRN
jgi:hypothetical protein